MGNVLELSLKYASKHNIVVGLYRIKMVARQYIHYDRECFTFFLFPASN